ncbi:transposase [Bosea sp. (in: a-proteobacteria)]|uniref:transposase n=1 Tax=Bosea sp. (in: a-proteobacteria) TaxID=1871050 RepID=UPI003F6F4AFF
MEHNCEVRSIAGAANSHWVVERTFGWVTRWKRLVRDYEQRLDVSEAMIHVALGSLMLRRVVYP